MPRINPKITPFLWFEDEAEEAAGFYTSLFEDSRILDVARYTAAAMRAMFEMKKIVIADIERAVEGA